MNLFLNAVSEKGVIILFDNKRDIVAKKDFNIRQRESSLLIGIIDDFLKENGQKYTQIKNIVVVSGPGSFTGIRTIILVINTLAFIFPNIELTPLSFFDLFDNYPIIKQASKRGVFVKFGEKDEIKNIKNEELKSLFKKNFIKKIYGDFPQEKTFFGINLEENVNFPIIIKNLCLKKQKQLNPLYIKKPSIS